MRGWVNAALVLLLEKCPPSSVSKHKTQAYYPQVLGDPSQDNFLKGLGGLGLVFLLLGQGGHLLRLVSNWPLARYRLPAPGL